VNRTEVIEVIEVIEEIEVFEAMAETVDLAINSPSQ
jgi:hypothetical protein